MTTTASPTHTLTVGTIAIFSEATPHTASRQSALHDQWTVTWLGARLLDRNEAITAMSLAAEPNPTPANREWSFLEGLAEELDLDLPRALALIAVPPARPLWHTYSSECWCDPTYQPAGDWVAHNGHQPVVFEPTDGDCIDVDGFAREDHRGAVSA